MFAHRGRDQLTWNELMNQSYPVPPPELLDQWCKEQALLVIDTAVNDYRMSSDAASIIRRALEALDD